MDAVWWLFCSSWLNGFRFKNAKPKRLPGPFSCENLCVIGWVTDANTLTARTQIIRTSTYTWAVTVDSTHGLSYTKADGVQCALLLTSVAKNSQFSTAQNSRLTGGITKVQWSNTVCRHLEKGRCTSKHCKRQHLMEVFGQLYNTATLSLGKTATGKNWTGSWVEPVRKFYSREETANLRIM